MDNSVSSLDLVHTNNHIHIFLKEELLIDFRELIGEHSGENMAEAVWATLELYGLTRKASFSLSNNTTFAKLFADHCHRNG
jgi:hypothetical protein